MKLHTFDGRDFDPAKVRELALGRDLVVLKKFMPLAPLERIKSELATWRKATPAHNSLDPYPKTTRNLHIPIENARKLGARQGDDYHESETLMRMHNFRIGNRWASDIQEKLPTICAHAPRLFETFYACAGERHMEHATTEGRNLFLELVHFPVNSGFIDYHTHQSIFDFGLKINMLMQLSRRGTDYEDGGVEYVDGEDRIFLGGEFDAGDAMFVRTDILHRVEPIRSKNPDHFREASGRWTMTFFYY